MKKSNQGEEYLEAFPKLKKWINECVCCHCKGYNPEMPEHISAVEGNMASYFIKKYFEPLKIDNDHLCERCSSFYKKR